MPPIHDSGYKKLFSNKVIFRQLIETFVKEDWVKDVDFDSCQTVDKSFVSDQYKKTESDIIYKLKIKDKEIYIFILIEFQSTVERFMVLRILNYITNFYMDYLQSSKGVKKLPAIFPILLYNGDATWTAPVRLADLIEDNERLGKFAINFEYFKIAENEYSKRDLLKIKNIVSTLFLAESYYDIELLKEQFLTIFDKESDKEAISLFLNWFKQLSEHGKIERVDYKSLEKIYTKNEEVQAMLIKALEKERKQLVQKGKIEGKVEGKLEGKIEERREIAKKMLMEGLEIVFITKITGLTETEIQQLSNERK
jgi:predicted transposase/invertase (TIGR01784 family)